MTARLVYLADVRMPTEKAHGWQIVKMCGAFADAGARVELWTPRRKQPGDAGADLFAYYGVPRTFVHRRLSNVDVIAMEPKMPERLVRPVVQTYAAAWEFQAALRAKRSRPTWIYTRDPAVAYWSARLRAPTISEVHHLPGSMGRRMIRRTAGGRVRPLVVALTPAIRDAYVRAGYPADRIIVEGDAIDPAPFRDLPTRPEARTQLGLPDAPLVGFIGRFVALEQERGVEDLIRAVGAMGAAGAGAAPTLVLLGGPKSEAPAYRELAARSGLASERLVIYDRVANAEVPRWIRALDAGVMPYPDTPHYAQELSPLKMFEYMAAGLPIVASDLPSIRLVLRDGENAVLVRPQDPSALAAGLTKVLADPAFASRIAARAAEDVAATTWDARAARILAAAAAGAAGAALS